MNDIQVSTMSQQAISLIISVGIPALVTLLFFILGAAGLRQFAMRIHNASIWIRPMVDQPTDPIVRIAETLGEAILQRDVDPVLVSQILTSVSDHMSRAKLSPTSEAIPLAERSKTPALRDSLAALAHAQWSGWMDYMFSKAPINADGSWTMPKDLVDRWDRQRQTLYIDLPESEKKSDLVEADRMIAVFGGSEPK